MASLNSENELNVNNLSKMKVTDLKKELKARGLSTAGAKNELIERLQQATSQGTQDLISEDGNAESEILDEDEVLGGEEEGGEFDDDEADAVLADEPKSEPAATSPISAGVKRPAPLANETSQEVQPKKRILVRPMSVLSGKENGPQEKNTSEENKKEIKDTGEKKIIKLSGISVKERLELRAQKFGVPLSEAAKKEARAARFGTATQPPRETLTVTTPGGGTTKLTVVGPSTEVLKKRAERFGCNVSSLATKVEELEKIKKRQERFGTAVVTTTTTKPPATANTAVSIEEKKKLRAERFKV